MYTTTLSEAVYYLYTCHFVKPYIVQISQQCNLTLCMQKFSVILIQKPSYCILICWSL